ncbi:hypothetical protein ACFVZ3_21900 [Kitasatospora purpeofusca]|uniref:hypothetical protein n=1 Tax=Kitasatospora purpeofusca TaxID=67352 RepID=UPI0036CE2C44
MGLTSDEDWTVSVGGGLLPPTTRPPAAALTEVWQTVRRLDLGPQQHAALRKLFGNGGTESVEAALDGGVFDFPVVLGGGEMLAVRVRRGDGLTDRQRLAARYRPEQLPGDGRNLGFWVVRDTKTGDLVSEDDRVLKWGVKASAASWISREVARNDYRGWNGRVAS